MPRKNYATKRRRTTRRRKRTYRRKNLKYRPVPSGMPATRRGYLRYCDEFSLTTTSGALDHYVFRANSVYDPNQSGTGHQPMGFDQWALLYNQYVVTGSKITVKLLGDTSISAPVAMGVILTDAITPPYSDWTGMREGRKGNMVAYTGRNASVINAVSKFSAKRYFNVSNVKDNLDNLGANTVINPQIEAFFIVWMQSLNLSTDTIQCMVQIDYCVDFSQPKDLAQS